MVLYRRAKFSKRINPGVRATQKLVMRGVGRNEVERIGANGIMEMDGVGRVRKGHVNVEVTCNDSGGVKSKGSKAVEKMNGVRSMRAAVDGGEEESELVLPNLTDNKLSRMVEDRIGG